MSTTRRSRTQAAIQAIVTAPIDPEVEWTRLKSQYTPYLSYKHICAYDGPTAGCPGCKEA